MSSDNHVLYIEDSVVSAELIKEYIVYINGVDIVIANTGEEGLQMVKSQKPDLILMDINLPGMNGIETMKAIRAYGPKYAKIPVIAISADAINEEIKRAMQAGFDDYLTKPIFFERLKETFQEYGLI